MDIIGSRTFVEIPGDKLHELPPLLVHGATCVRKLDKVMEMAEDIVRSEELMVDAVPDELDAERRKLDLAVNLVEQYLTFRAAWQWGEDIIEWIRQCETTFQFSLTLRNILRPDVWPHASRSSFVTLLNDKAIDTGGFDLRKAVGMRLTFRQPPPIRCFSNQFLLYLNSSVAATAYSTWSQMAPEPVSSLPPERFRFEVLKIDAAASLS
jgi:hypothetical protein